MPPAEDAALDPAKSFQGLILTLQTFWARQGCVMLQPYDMEVGAGTFHPATTLRSLGPKAWKAAYVQPSRRPKDGRYGENPNRLQHYYQYQVILKPSPENLQELYLDSLEAIGIDMALHDVRFVEDDWESPTLGAWGLGWECWCDGMEVSQFTYFQQVAGFECAPVSGELTYGLERLAMYVQGVDSIFDINFNGRDGAERLTYGDVFQQAEEEYSRFNFEHANTGVLIQHFRDAEAECRSLLERGEAGHATSWRSRLMTSASRRAMPSTFSTRAAQYRSPSARATSSECASSPRRAARPGSGRRGAGRVDAFVIASREAAWRSRGRRASHVPWIAASAFGLLAMTTRRAGPPAS